MNNPTCPQCDCVAGCQANPALCPNFEQSTTGSKAGVLQDDSREFSKWLSNRVKTKREAIAQPEQPAADLERYITANYPNAEGDTLTDRVIFALETMDIALGMKEIAQPVPPATAAASSEFIKRTNEDYSAWCRSYYQADALDERGMMSFHGLWAWQEQERRKVCTPIAQPVQPAPKITAYMTSYDDGDMLFFDKDEARRYCDDDSEPEPLVLLSDIAQPKAQP